MEKNSSTKDLLKSTGIIGFSKVITIVLGIFQTKIISLLIGSSGIGIIGLYRSNFDLIRNLTSFGIGYSAVKSIAASPNDSLLVSKEIITIKRWAIFTGLLGFFITAIFSNQLSLLSFGDKKHALLIAIGSLSLFFTSINEAQLALVQGKRLISKLAIITIITSSIIMLVTIPIYWHFRQNGILIVLVLMPLISMIIAWTTTRKIKYDKIKLTFKESFYNGLSMAKLGSFIVINGFIATLSMYVIRSILNQKFGLSVVGLFYACWTISNMYVGIILNAMLADFFPRLSQLSCDNKKSNELINDQLRIALLVGTPVTVFIIGFGQYVLNVLYSSEFEQGLRLLQWLHVNVFIILIVWPLGVLFLSRDKGLTCILIDTIWNIFALAFFFLSVYICKLPIEFIGVSFCIATIIKLIVTLFLVKKLSDYQISKENINLILSFAVCIILIINNCYFVKTWIQYLFTGFILLVVSSISVYGINNIYPFKNIILKFNRSNI